MQVSFEVLGEALGLVILTISGFVGGEFVGSGVAIPREPDSYCCAARSTLLPYVRCDKHCHAADMLGGRDQPCWMPVQYSSSHSSGFTASSRVVRPRKGQAWFARDGEADRQAGSHCD